MFANRVQNVRILARAPPLRAFSSEEAGRARQRKASRNFQLGMAAALLLVAGGLPFYWSRHSQAHSEQLLAAKAENEKKRKSVTKAMENAIVQRIVNERRAARGAPPVDYTATENADFSEEDRKAIWEALEAANSEYSRKTVEEGKESLFFDEDD